MGGLKQNRPLVSVVMIAWNKERYIDRAIASVVKQQGDFDVQLIVNDDCSTDSTGEIARRWAERYPSVVEYYRNERNLGLQRNYIAAFGRARGKYMAICDADDFWIGRSKLRRQVEWMEAHPDYSVCFHRVVNLYEDSGEKSLSNGGLKGDFNIEDLSRSNFITNLSVMYRRELVDLNNLPEWLSTDTNPDYAMHLLYARHGLIHYIRRPLGVYRKTSDGVWSMVDAYVRLKNSLQARINLMNHFADDEDVVAGLKMSSKGILRGMNKAATDDDKLREVKDFCGKIGIDYDAIADAGIRKPGAMKRVLTAVRRQVSKLVGVRLIELVVDL